MPGFDESMMQELLQTFRVEAVEHVQILNQSLLMMERKPTADAMRRHLQDAFRAAHSLKGAARAVNLKSIEAIAHAMENILQQARDAGRVLDADTCDGLYDGLDGIQALLEDREIDTEQLQLRLADMANLNSGESHSELVNESPQKPIENMVEETPAPAIPEPPAPAHAPVSAPLTSADNNEAHILNGLSASDTIRVSTDKLDDLMAQVGELIVLKISADQRQIDVRAIRHHMMRWSKMWSEIQHSLGHLNGNLSKQAYESLRRYGQEMEALVQSFNEMDQAITRDTLRLNMVTNSLQDKVRHVRMIPFQTLVLALERAVRDAARTQEKDISFFVQGGDVELDKKVLETLKDPLLHLLRNAVVHGIEDEAGRLKRGKDSTGQIHLSVALKGSEVHITVRDDGRGFDLDHLRKIYQQRGGEGAEASDDEIISMAFLPGVSTATDITTLSGRGVGLDVVRQQIEAIQGRISVSTNAGYGSSFNLVVPISLAMTRGLLVRAGGQHYGLPLLSVEKILEPKETIAVSGKHMLRVNGTPLPLVSLSSLLEQPGSTEDENHSRLAIIMAVADQRVALLVDDALTEQELAIKPLSAPLKRVRNVAGAALLGNGDPVIILNPSDLIRSAKGTHLLAAPIKRIGEAAEQVSRQVLVVDDSITTRTLEKNILEAAGYVVYTATDGQEALKRLSETKVDIVVSDIEMPRMDGFNLTRTLRESNEFNHLPIILVTSLESESDREQGMMAGANAYIVKRGFDQAELLATIENLL